METVSLLLPIVFVYIVLYCTFCGICIKYAGRLNRNQFFWAIVAIWFTPFVAAILLHCLGPVEEFED